MLKIDQKVKIKSEALAARGYGPISTKMIAAAVHTITGIIIEDNVLSYEIQGSDGTWLENELSLLVNNIKINNRYYKIGDRIRCTCQYKVHALRINVFSGYPDTTRIPACNCAVHPIINNV